MQVMFDIIVIMADKTTVNAGQRLTSKEKLVISHSRKMADNNKLKLMSDK